MLVDDASDDAIFLLRNTNLTEMLFSSYLIPRCKISSKICSTHHDSCEKLQLLFRTKIDINGIGLCIDLANVNSLRR